MQLQHNKLLYAVAVPPTNANTAVAQCVASCSC